MSQIEDTPINESVLEDIVLSPIADKSRIEEESKLDANDVIRFGALAKLFPVEQLRVYWEKFNLKEIFPW